MKSLLTLLAVGASLLPLPSKAQYIPDVCYRNPGLWACQPYFQQPSPRRHIELIQPLRREVQCYTKLTYNGYRTTCE
jgi:hypothetical protein